MNIEFMLKITEHEFGNILLKSAEIQKLVKTSNFLVAREFKVGSAVPDFVLISATDHFKIVELSNRFPASVFRGTSSSIICMLYGPSHVKSLQHIANANFIPIETVLKTAKKLDELGILSLNVDKLLIHREVSFQLPQIDVISLELKLDKWKKALWQASRNKAFYAKSYVVMPSDKEDLIRQNLDYFNVNGISVVVVDPTKGKIKFIGREKRKDTSASLTTQRLAGLSYLMQGQNNFSPV